jgi:RNA polymerase sigma-70 factor, ECF subfamily
VAERLTAEIPRLRSFLGRLAIGKPGGRSPADVDDLVQESLARALRFQTSFDDRRAIWPWLKRTAFRVFLDQQERFRALPTPSNEAIAEVGVSDTDHGAQREGVQRLLAVLPAVEREILLSFHRDGREVREISSELGMPEGTVKSHLHRARRRLAERGGEEDHE